MSKSKLAKLANYKKQSIKKPKPISGKSKPTKIKILKNANQSELNLSIDDKTSDVIGIDLEGVIWLKGEACSRCSFKATDSPHLSEHVKEKHDLQNFDNEVEDCERKDQTVCDEKTITNKSGKREQDQTQDDTMDHQIDDGKLEPKPRKKDGAWKSMDYTGTKSEMGKNLLKSKNAKENQMSGKFTKKYMEGKKSTERKESKESKMTEKLRKFPDSKLSKSSENKIAEKFLERKKSIEGKKSMECPQFGKPEEDNLKSSPYLDDEELSGREE